MANYQEVNLADIDDIFRYCHHPKVEIGKSEDVTCAISISEYITGLIVTIARNQENILLEVAVSPSFFVLHQPSLGKFPCKYVTYSVYNIIELDIPVIDHGHSSHQAT